ncbi:MAG: hypothetical protein A2026_04085 [Deltaproteobacteria bacterium RBG_19FT_COMBO_46_12]|nr:MAG: hypothetical protein A2026_04085 [Deltaproteobacteria bacterium RBG_19FT_COMBO_46_12]
MPPFPYYSFKYGVNLHKRARVVNRGDFLKNFGKHLQIRDDRMDSRGAGGPDSEIFRIAGH